MEQQYKNLIEEAIKFIRRAYSPYSNLKIGAAVLTSDGKIYAGCNIECVSFSLTLCAERVAAAKALSEGNKKIKAVAIATQNKKFVFPCGACLQFLSEFATPETDIILIQSKNKYKVVPLKSLLPNAFSF
jgi:cytidine deaminase